MRLILVAIAFALTTAPVLAQQNPRCAPLLAAFAPGTTSATTASGLRYTVVRPGAKKPVKGNVAIESYVVCFTNGKLLDASPPGKTFAFTIGAKQVIKGTEEATQLIGQGGEILAYLPANLAYGAKGRPPSLPANSDLIFDIHLTGMASMSLSTMLTNAYAHGGIAAMNAAYSHASHTGFKGLYASEDDLNSLGYAFLKKKHTDAAVTALAYNVRRFPKSWNAYDSLGDAYKAAGNKPQAIADYRRALQLNPKDANASTSIKILIGKVK